VSRVVSAAGRCAPPEVERFALQLGISAALAKGCQKLVVISDSLPAVESLFSVELRSGQIFSLDSCCAVGPWLAGDPERSVHLWFVPSRMEWGAQRAAHDVVVSLKIAVGRRPRTSRDFLLHHTDVDTSFFFFFQQLIMQGSLAVRGPAVQTVRTLRLRYALPITTYQVLEASFWRATTDIRPAASSKTTSPFRAVNAGASHQAAEIAMSIPGLPSERSPDQNPPQRVGQSPAGVKPP
jgi:hypothetical protein